MRDHTTNGYEVSPQPSPHHLHADLKHVLRILRLVVGELELASEQAATLAQGEEV